MGSLIPFFITARYRLPVVPFLIVFASVGIFEAADLMRRRSFKRLSVAVVAGLVAAAVVGRFIVDYDFGFSHTVMGTAYSELATKEPDKAPGHIEKAVIEFKKALELTPLSVDAHYNLGVVYQRVGYFSGAVERLEAAAALKPDHTYAAKALRESRLSLEETGDKINPKVLPRTPFEAGLEYTLSGMEGAAERQYKRVLKEDPHHPGAYSQLGAISFQRKEYGEAIAYFKTGLKYRPDHFVLNNNLAGAYYRAGEYGKARRHWEKCLTTQPGNESVLEQLRMLESK
jgi:tetratricopeptide (TPR) repeat protein